MGRRALPNTIPLPPPTSVRESTVNQAILDTYLLLRQYVSNVAIITFGLDADIPASTGSGALYWATDTDTLYYDEAGGWVAVGGTGGGSLIDGFIGGLGA